MSPKINLEMQQKYPNEPIAIIGTSCRFPGNSTSTSKLWHLLKEPRDVQQEIPESRFSTAAFYHADGSHHGTTNVKHSYLLDQDVGVFDANFFGIKPVEANSVDPQQRILLEVVYEGLEKAGLPLESLQGSNTGVYVGVMSADYMEMLARDIDDFPTYFASGTARSILSNRISYFFDWHGPSMTIDTACSSSLYALHQAVGSLRSGECSTAVVAGANLQLSPEQFVAESKLQMLSPDGRSRMWDKDANGYARGDGVAALVLKTLSAALSDGDSIECLIRETGINQDGRTKGITMPSATAQADLIWSTYKKAGLDLSKQSDRPQYFEAHGTGTPAGDPIEAQAIDTAFFGPVVNFKTSPTDHPLYVGSIKTVIGHTEGTAGVASVIKASLALQSGVVPPNLLLNEVSPAVAPYYKNLRILNKAAQWPDVPAGGTRRVSVNSFGFGGANAHAILESYEPEPETTTVQQQQQQQTTSEQLVQLSPFNFSAASEKQLQQILADYSSYLNDNPHTNLRDLSWTLDCRRSTLPVRLSVPASTAELLRTKLDELSKSPVGQVTGKAARSDRPAILGIFTGQGAQWPQMGYQLITSSREASAVLDSLQVALDTLPEEHRPQWTLRGELCKGKETSRVGEAEFSQPLCTAVQIILVHLLQKAQVPLKAVVGHSSGEIAAAYISGHLSAQDAIRVAYYRGYFLHLARGPQDGAMLAVGTSYQDAQALCEIVDYAGRIVVAASNSPESQTLSGDIEAIRAAKDVLDDEGKFARLLKVDKAYHSQHMLACSEAYIKALSNCGCYDDDNAPKQPTLDGNLPTWISSVYGEPAHAHQASPAYWNENMVSEVKFRDAVTYAAGSCGPFDMCVEFGPHPALKGPVMEIIKALSGYEVPYTGLLRRDIQGLDSFAQGLGALWQHLGSGVVDMTSFEDRHTLGGGLVARPPRLLTNLPEYSWDHSRVYWHESRQSKAFRTNTIPPHALLGTRMADGTSKEIRWRNYLSTREVPWLVHHQVECQVVFPAAGYISATLEAIVQLYGIDSLELIELQDVVIGQALILPENSQIETTLSISISQHSENRILGTFAFYSASPKDPATMGQNASGKFVVNQGTLVDDTTLLLPPPYVSVQQFLDVDVARFYGFVDQIGLGYTGPFRNLTETRRRLGEACGVIQTHHHHQSAEYGDDLLVHPATLDCAIQSIILAYSFPGDGRMQSIYLPTGIKTFRVNIAAISKLVGRPSALRLPFYSSVTTEEGFSSNLAGDVEIHSPDSRVTLMQLQGLATTPLTPPSDIQRFFETSWDVESPKGVQHMAHGDEHSEDYALSYSLERVALYYVSELDKAVTVEERKKLDWHHQIFYNYVDHVVAWVNAGTHPYAKKEWVNDSYDDIEAILQRYPNSIDLRIMRAVGENMVPSIRGEMNILEAMMKDNMLGEFYAVSLGMEKYLLDMARMAGQLGHRYPNMNIFEIGAGTGGATDMILNRLQGSFASYTYTDISSGFFEKAQDKFAQYRSRMNFKVFDAEKSVEQQGYTPHSYDLVIASLVLHATHNLEETLRNARGLLKPGGRLLMLELTDNDPIRFSFIFGGLPGWWLGYNEGRKLSPCLPIEGWESILVKTGFSQIEAITPHNKTFPLPVSVILTQAFDDQVSFLNNPLSSEVPSLAADALTIVGNRTPCTMGLAESISRSVSRHYTSDIKQIASLEILHAYELPLLGSVVILVDLEEDDDATFENLTIQRLDGLKKLFKQSKNIIWATSGSLASSPYRNMFRGLRRTVEKESPHLRVFMLDFGAQADISSDMIASRLLQLEAASAWKRDDKMSNLLWYDEPEVLFRDGHAFVPRVRLSFSRNRRYNSARRLTVDTVSLDKTVVSIATTQSRFSVSQERTIDKGTKTKTQAPAPGHLAINLSASLTQAIKIAGDSYLYLSTGYEVGSGSPVIVLTDKLHSQVHTPSSWAQTTHVEFESTAQSVLVNVAAELAADSVFSTIGLGETVVVLNPDVVLGTTLIQRAVEKGVRLVLLVTDSSGKFLLLPRPWNVVHTKSSTRDLRKAIPASTTTFINLGGSSSELVSSIAAVLPACCIIRSEPHLSRSEPSVVVKEPSAMADIAAQLAVAWVRCTIRGQQSSTNTKHQLPVINISDLTYNRIKVSDQALVSWTSTAAIPVQVRPATRIVQFAPDRTYWMIGLAGSLGLSLCQWMAQRGAKYIALSSRNPQVDQAWLRSMESLGCQVQVFANDITSRQDVNSVYQQITASLPPIAGVAHGAMVLDDGLFSDIDMASLHKIMRPKVRGSILLDEIFADNTLDFFVLFSSVAYVTGNIGQSIYGASSAFMASLAAQRRNRGLAASVINIGAILGAGYVSRELSLEQQEYLHKVGLTWMSEQDAHEIFAEGILCSRPSEGLSGEFETGFRMDAQRAKDLLNEPPLLQHLGSGITQIGKEDVTRTKHQAGTRTRLLDATSQDQVFDIVKDCFIQKLQVALLADASKDMLDISLENLGADSLVAVELRSWFMNELSVDVPVLKILNAPSVRALLDTALQGLSPKMIPNISEHGQQPAAAATNGGDLQRPNSASASLPGDLPRLGLGGDESSLPDSPPLSSTVELPSTSAQTLSTGTLSSSYGSSTSHTQTEPSEADESDDIKSLPQQDEIIQRKVRMSFGQSRFWFLKHYVQDETAFNITTTIELGGKLDAKSLSAALDQVCNRHEALRTRFSVDLDTIQPQQIVLKASRVKLEVRSVDSEADMSEIAEAVKRHMYDIEGGESLRLILVTQSAHRHWLILGYHHILLDGIGYVNFLQDLDSAYHGTLDIQAKVTQYPDFAVRQHNQLDTGAWAAQLEYWRRKFTPLPEPLPILPLAGRSSRPQVGQFGSHEHKIRLDTTITDAVVAVGRRFKVTPFHIYLSALQVTLNRYKGEYDDVCIGLADGNRRHEHDLKSLGLFLDILPVRLAGNSRQTFSEVIQATKTAAQEAFSHAGIPFDVLLRETKAPPSTLHSPLFQAFFNYRQNVQEVKTLLGCQGKLNIIATGQTDYDVTLDILDLAAHRSETLVVVACNKALYKPAAAESFAKSYRNILAALVDNPAARVTWPQLHNATDIQQAALFGRGPEIQTHHISPIHLVTAMTEKYPQRTALKSDGASLTYQELAQRVNSIAGALINLDIHPQSCVGVYQKVGLDWICCMLAILQVGATYVPLDARVGLQRLSQIVADCSPAVILFNSAVEQDELLRQRNRNDDHTHPLAINVDDIETTSSSAAIPTTESPESTAVIIYSSGSTGVPKGVQTSHANLANYVETIPEVFGVRQGQEVFLHQVSYMFDASILQTLVALAIGATVIVVNAEQRRDPSQLVDLINKHSVTVTGATPTEYVSWSRFWDHKVVQASSWKLALTWGEALSKPQVREFQSLAKPDLRLMDSYGPSETTITTAHAEVDYLNKDIDEVQSRLSVVPNTVFYILDDSLNRAPCNVVGEIFIGGASVSKGYLNDDSLTAERFIPNKFTNNDGGFDKLHRTGDCGRFTADGHLILHGRIKGSTQIKMAGNRIDLQDVESTLSQHPSVKAVAVSARGLSDSSTTPFLAAFVVLNELGSQALAELAQYSLLPQYMRPSVVVPVEALPINSSGKLNRQQLDEWPLPLPDTVNNKSNSDKDLTQPEVALLELWKSVFPKGLPMYTAIDGNTDFFTIGGNSLLLIDLQHKIRDTMNVIIPLQQLFQRSSLSGMASAIQQDLLPTPIADCHEVDWHTETTLPPDFKEIAAVFGSSSQQSDKYSVALTGATGFIGREILRQLVSNNRISSVHCLAVRKNQSELRPRALFEDPKVFVHKGDLSLPSLGLSDKAISSMFESTSGISFVIHGGADVSFMKTYQTLKLTNVASLRELIRLSTPRRLPLHFISSASVSRLAVPYGRTSFGLESIRSYPPNSPDAAQTNGYAASKWVSEIMLENAVSELGIRVWIHRPTSVTGEDTNTFDLMSNMMKYAQEIQAIPDTTSWAGQFDFVSVQSTAQSIIAEALAGQDQDRPVGQGQVKYVFQSGEIVMVGDEMQTVMELGSGKSFDVLSFDEWITRAEVAGMNPLLVLYLRRAEMGQFLLPDLIKSNGISV